MLLDPRPPTVLATRFALLAVGVTSLVAGVLGLFVHDELAAAYDAAITGTGRGDGAATSAVTVAVVTGLTLAVVYSVPAVLVGRPRNWRRIVAWVCCGLSLCWMGPGLRGTSMTTPKLDAVVHAALPVWYVAATTGLAALGLGAAALAAVLLALPESNAYFRGEVS